MSDADASLTERELQGLQRLSTVPNVFMFQPTSYEVLTGDRLKDWEGMLRERVGLRAQMRPHGSPSISWCDGLDDCDEI